LTETEAVLERILNELHASHHPGPLPEVEGE
jgi:hypothetical protein